MEKHVGMHSITALWPGLLLNWNPAQLMTKHLQLTVSIETKNCSGHREARRHAAHFGKQCMGEGLGEDFTVEVVSHFLCWARSPLTLPQWSSFAERHSHFQIGGAYAVTQSVPKGLKHCAPESGSCPRETGMALYRSSS